MATKKISFNDRWDEFELNGINVLTRFLSHYFDDAGAGGELKNNQVFDNKQFMALYKIIYDLCIVPKGNFSKTLYSKYIEVTSKYLTDNVLPDLVEASGVILLKKLANHWDTHVNIFVKWLGKWFRYLDQHYVKQYSLETVSAKGESLFKLNVFVPIKISVFNAIVKEFEKERDGEWIDDYSLKVVIQMIIKFNEHSLDEQDYFKELENQVIGDTVRYYSKEAKSFLSKYNWEEYLLKVDRIIEEEKERVTKYLIESSYDLFLSVVQQELLVKNMDAILDKPSGLHFILNNHIVKNMKLIHNLYWQLPEWLREIANRFKIYISNKGNEIVTKWEESLDDVDKNLLIGKIIDSTFIEEIITFWENYMTLLSKDLNRDTYFVTAFESAFSSFLNRSVKDHTIAEILGRSCDKVLKKGNQILSEVKIYKFIENITNLFSYMEDKDLFIDVYRWGLAKRLLDNKWASIDYEKTFIGKIKMSWGPQYTSKVEGMLSDSNSDSVITKEYYDSISYQQIQIDFEVKVLTDGYWPSFKSPPIILPPQLNNWVASFEKFYVDKNKMRHLSWSYMHGSWNVKAIFDEARQYDLSLTTYQTCIVMLFNESNELSFTDIFNMLKTDDNLIRKMLESLSCKKYRILLKTGKNKEVSKDDVFSVNSEFKSKLKQLAISAPMIKETFNKEKVDIDRTHAIEAAIVKIMKSRKKMNYIHLLNEVMTILQMFKPTASAIKARIESLIEKDYIERDSEDSNLFRYLA